MATFSAFCVSRFRHSYFFMLPKNPNRPTRATWGHVFCCDSCAMARFAWREFLAAHAGYYTHNVAGAAGKTCKTIFVIKTPRTLTFLDRQICNDHAQTDYLLPSPAQRNAYEEAYQGTHMHVETIAHSGPRGGRYQERRL